MKYDLIIIGGGAAGFAAAETAVRGRAKVCLIEQEQLGGECPNWACVPTKALLASARHYYRAKHELRAFGVRAQTVSFSFRAIMERKDAVVATITGEGKRLEKRAEELGIVVVKGSAVFVDAHTVVVGRKKLYGTSIVLATGTVPFIPPIADIEHTPYLTYRDVVSLKRQPRSLVIVGGGPVACEFATFFAMLGTKVTLVELRDTILNHEDTEIAAIASAQMRALGVDVHVGAKVLSSKRAGKRVEVTYQVGSSPRGRILVDAVVLAAGTRPAVDSLALDKAGVKLDSRGRLKSDVYQRTNVKHIFAAGDVDGGFQFTHMAHVEGSVAGHNAVAKSVRSFKKRDDRVVPRVTFVYPEVASVGMTVQEANAKKNVCEIASYPVGSLGRSVTDNQRIGLLKCIVEKKTGRILGAHMIGERAGEVIHELALAMHTGATAKEVASLIHAFPTYSESIGAALASYE